MTIQDEVKRYIEEKGVKKVFIAKQIDVTPAMFSHWLHGRVQFSKYKLDKILSIIRDN